MKEPKEIFAYIDEKCRAEQRIDLSGKKIIVTAGGTVEPIDPVRFLTNRSSGKMGYALAENAAAFGADVTVRSDWQIFPALRWSKRLLPMRWLQKF